MPHARASFAIAALMLCTRPTSQVEPCVTLSGWGHQQAAKFPEEEEVEKEDQELDMEDMEEKE